MGLIKVYYPDLGIYCYSADSFKNEHMYRFEANYYIKYNAEKALYAYEQIENAFKDMKEECFFYHVYLDLLFEAVGSLVKRFKTKNKYSVEWKQQIENNIYEYSFNDKNYPTLNEVYKVRNFIEHIDERGVTLIDKDMFQGTFNVVFPNMSQGEKEQYLNNDKLRMNLFDLSSMNYYIYSSEKNEELFYSINIADLKCEVESIYKTAIKIWNYINNHF